MSAATVAATRRPRLPRGVRIGLVAGGVSIYLCAVGMVSAFDERNVVTGVIRLGRMLLLLVALGAGFAAARGTRAERDVAPGGGAIGAILGRAALAGALSGTLTGLLLIVTDSLRPPMFVALGARLVEILSLGLSTTVAAVLLIVIGAIAGLAGGGIQVLPRQIRRPLVTGLVAVLGVSLAEPLLGAILGNPEGLNLDTAWLYQAGGLTVSGALIVFVVAVAISLFRTQRGAAVRERIQQMGKGGRLGIRVAGLLVLVAILAVLPILVGGFVSLVLTIVGLFVLLGLGLNIVVGYAGLLDLGYVAFYAVGAYTTAILTSTASFLVTDENTRFAEQPFTNFWIALPMVVIVAIIIGLLIGAPVLRLRGDYLAIVTLGFGEIVRTLVLSEWLSPWLGGAQGIIQIQEIPPEAFDFGDPQRLFYAIIAFCFLAAYVSYRLADSRVGRAWAAMREDESVAEAMGVSVIKYKLLAFAMGAAIGCLGGAFFAAQIGSIFPNSFSLLVSINVLALLVLGGMGSIPGVVIGSFVLVGLPELLREFREFRLLIFGAVLVLIMVLRPEGLLPNVRRRRELHVEETEEEQYERRTGDVETGAPVVAGAADEPDVKT